MARRARATRTRVPATNRNGHDAAAPDAEPSAAAAEAGLRYVSDSEPGLRRVRAGRSFKYVDAAGQPIRERKVLARIRSLAIPPAYADVWICADPLGHLQATGRDARRRKQYRYHPRWREVRDSNKYERAVAFGRALPAIRARVAADMAGAGLGLERVLATTVRLLDRTLMRIGNDSYRRENDSFGLTTLRNRHARVNGAEVAFTFRGKGGKPWAIRVRDRRLARLVKSCQELPGQTLFQYLDDQGAVRSITSNDVNAYLREIGGEDFTAKDFRTWAGTVLCALALSKLERPESAAAEKRLVRQAIEAVAAVLGNTPAICRKCYVHPAVIAAYRTGALHRGFARRQARRAEHLRPAEAALLKLLETGGPRPAGSRRTKRSAIPEATMPP
jgi:DNA topoisomerase I